MPGRIPAGYVLVPIETVYELTRVAQRQAKEDKAASARKPSPTSAAASRQTKSGRRKKSSDSTTE